MQNKRRQRDEWADAYADMGWLDRVYMIALALLRRFYAPLSLLRWAVRRREFLTIRVRPLIIGKG